MQLKRDYPALSILVVEKRTHPAPEAAHKVGESSVEIGAHFFQRVLDLDSHLQADELPKLGLATFSAWRQSRHRSPSRVRSQIVSKRAILPDRPRPVQNHVLELNRDLGIEVVDGASVRDLQLGAEVHTVNFSHSEDPQRRVTGRWIVDCSGRAGLLRRRLGLTQPVGHTANACWLHIQERLKVDDWSSHIAWRSEVPSGERWLSTNHIMGRGYWVWLIPLGSGSTSVGIVADEPLHPLNQINRFERAIDWLRELRTAMRRGVERHSDKVAGHSCAEALAYGCKRVFSPDRWMLTGEAGEFTDPFYSPDPISLLSAASRSRVVGRAVNGEDIGDRIERYNKVYLGLFDAFSGSMKDNTRLMGNAQVMTVKAAWDNACYWVSPALLYFPTSIPASPNFFRRSIR